MAAVGPASPGTHHVSASDAMLQQQAGYLAAALVLLGHAKQLPSSSLHALLPPAAAHLPGPDKPITPTAALALTDLMLALIPPPYFKPRARASLSLYAKPEHPDLDSNPGSPRALAETVELPVSGPVLLEGHTRAWEVTPAAGDGQSGNMLRSVVVAVTRALGIDKPRSAAEAQSDGKGMCEGDVLLVPELHTALLPGQLDASRSPVAIVLTQGVSYNAGLERPDRVMSVALRTFLMQRAGYRVVHIPVNQWLAAAQDETSAFAFVRSMFL
ncbi:hypothetical protein V8C86DRAFT_2478662 [Haematococcus lacustris]